MVLTYYHGTNTNGKLMITQVIECRKGKGKELKSGEKKKLAFELALLICDGTNKYVDLGYNACQCLDSIYEDLMTHDYDYLKNIYNDVLEDDSNCVASALFDIWINGRLPRYRQAQFKNDYDISKQKTETQEILTYARYR